MFSNPKRETGNQFLSHFVFHSLVHKKGLGAIGCFGLFIKIKKESETSFIFPCLTLYQLTKFQYQTFFPSQDIK